MLQTVREHQAVRPSGKARPEGAVVEPEDRLMRVGARARRYQRVDDAPKAAVHGFGRLRCLVFPRMVSYSGEWRIRGRALR